MVFTKEPPFKGEKTESLINVGHNLESLWNRAYEKKTLSIPKAPPDWVKILSLGHGRKFYFRYQEGEKDQQGERTVVHGGQTPALIPMAVELKKLIEMVGLAIKQRLRGQSYIIHFSLNGRLVVRLKQISISQRRNGLAFKSYSFRR